MSGTVPKELRPLLKRARKAGCTIEQTAKSHLQIRGPGGRVLATCPGTSVNRRLVRNVETALRRGGVSL